ncbi:MAG: tetratricopeptide repeat protein [Bacteroidales bacterium]|jgi:Flp pilus assembly protein TadD|nr:tetratricopeptide repeat protein [Bacteroidales bacterium]
MSKKILPPILICMAILLVYGNTLTLDYALDDRLVIYQNDYTLMGFDGVKDVMTNDGFAGYFGKSDNLVTGGRYRPLAQLTFILEYELFGKSIHEQVGMNKATQNEQLFIDVNLPVVSHLGNILCYILLCLLIYVVLSKIFPVGENAKWYFSLSFLATLLFALHPIHTEAVANIKGRDEILSMLGGMGTLYFVLQHISKRNWIYLLLSFFTLSFGLLAKENAITFIAIIPLVLYFSKKEILKSDWIVTLIPSLLAIILFLIARYMVLGGWMPTDETNTILNNPFIESTTAQYIATVIFTWGIYLNLLIFPHPLTHDYYPRQIEITSFANPWVIILTIFFVFIVVYAVKALKKRDVVSFGILFFIIIFSIVSNLFINIGTFMNERFLFTPLLGFTIILTYYFIKLFDIKKIKVLSPIVLSLLILFYTGKTISRNRVWHDDFTLFSTDVQVSHHSIKCNVSAGGSYLEKYKKEERSADLKKAEKYLYKAFTLDKTSYYANLLLGETYFFLEQYDLSYMHYKNAAILKPEDKMAAENAQISLLKMEAAQLENANKQLDAGNVKEAMAIVNDYLSNNVPSAYAYNLKGRIFGMGMQNLDSSIVYLMKALELIPDYSSALENLGVAYAIKGDFDKAMHYLQHAHEADPENAAIIQNITRVHANMEREKP